MNTEAYLVADDLTFEEEFAQHIATIAETLDEFIPGWYHRINTDNLSMMSEKLCIAGQIGWNWVHLAQAIGWSGKTGFRIGEIESCFASGGHLWTREINDRLTSR